MIVADLSPQTASRLAMVEAGRSIQETANLFADGRLGLVVVCDEAGLAVGVVSKSDLVRYLARHGNVASPVALVMTRTVIAGAPTDELHGTWQLMVRRRLQNLPLLGPNRRPVGTLDIRDAFQAIVEFEQAQETQLVNYIAGIGYR